MGRCSRALGVERQRQRPRHHAFEEVTDASSRTGGEATLASPSVQIGERSTGARGGRPAGASPQEEGVEGGVGEGDGGKTRSGVLYEAADAAAAEHLLQREEDPAASGDFIIPADGSSTKTSDAADHDAPADARGRRARVVAEGGAAGTARKDACAAPGLEIRYANRPHRFSNVSSTTTTAAAEGADAETTIIGSAPADASSTPTTSPASVTATPTTSSATPADLPFPSRTGRPNSKGSTLGPSGCRCPHEDKTGNNDNDGDKHDEDELVDPQVNDERK